MARLALLLWLAAALFVVLSPSFVAAEEFPVLDYPNGFLKQPCPNSGPYKKERLPDNTTEHFYAFTVGWFRAGAAYNLGKTPNYVFDANNQSTFDKARTTGLDAYLYYNLSTGNYDYIRDKQGTLSLQSLSPADTQCHAILMDGIQREVLAVNGQVPGPMIRVNEGDTINVRVCNSMYTKGQAITLHWHGMFQRNTPWMDGVAAVSQPGIFPLQCFTYRFKAEPAGTWWWHSHQGVQYSDGLYGPLIVDRKVELQHHRGFYNHRLDDAMLMMGDWMHEDTASLVGNFKRQWRDGRPECDPESGEAPSVDCVYTFTKQQDGATMGMVQYMSAVVNGRGRYRFGTPGQQKAPLTVFGLPEGDRRRFRVVNTGMAYALELSVDGHNLTVIRADGFDIRPRKDTTKPFVVDSLIVAVGERFDLIIAGDQDPNQTYWIRIRTLQDPALNAGYMDGDNEGYAVLKYCQFNAANVTNDCAKIIGGSLWYREWEPETTRKVCTPEDTCKVLNCPWIDPQGQYNPVTHPNRECAGVGDTVMHCTGARTDGHCQGVPPPLLSSLDEMLDRTTFINWGFSNSASANGKKFWIPNATALTNSQQAVPCNMDKSNSEICTQTIRLEGGGPAWFVWVNDAVGGNAVIDAQNYAGGGQPVLEPHPMHMHGHSFYVLKYGYPSNVSVTDGDVKDAWSQDIEWQVPGATANKNGPMKNPNFTAEAWAKVMDPNSGFLNMQDPPRKDTIMIPPGGYVMLAIHADNPGWWIIHCHIEPHVAMGMAAVINEWPSADNLLQEQFLPKDFPRMASFPSDIDFSGATDRSTVPCVYRDESSQCENTFALLPTDSPSCPACPSLPASDSQTCSTPSPSSRPPPPSCPECEICSSVAPTVGSRASQSGFMSGTTLQLFAVGSIAMLSLAVLLTQA